MGCSGELEDVSSGCFDSVGKVECFGVPEGVAGSCVASVCVAVGRVPSVGVVPEAYLDSVGVVPENSVAPAAGCVAQASGGLMGVDGRSSGSDVVEGWVDLVGVADDSLNVVGNRCVGSVGVDPDSLGVWEVGGGFPCLVEVD